MANYSIKDLEILTGIKAHTIRIWEQRYDILEPQRSDTNIRHYSDKDLRHLLNVALLNKNGHKISKLAQMSDRDIATSILEISQDANNYLTQIDGLVLSMINYDEAGFEKIISLCKSSIGFENTVINVLFPFLVKIGVMWQTAMVCPAQEHFITNLIRQKIIAEIDAITLVKEPFDGKKFLLYLPEKETHEISLLFLHFLLKLRKNSVLYLGINVPLEDVKTTVEAYNPDYIFSIFTSYPLEDQLVRYVHRCKQNIPNHTLIISGRIIESKKEELKTIGEGLKVFDSFETTFEFLQKLDYRRFEPKLN